MTCSPLGEIPIPGISSAAIPSAGMLLFGPQHGQGIARAIQTQSDDVLVDHGSLYPALQRLEGQGWISAEWGFSTNNRKARFYKLTQAGRRQLSRETSDWRRLTAAIARVLGPQQSEGWIVFRRKRSQQDFQAELQAHIEMEAETLQSEGMCTRDAEAAARRRFGNVLHAEERFYRSHHWLWLDHLRRDALYACRLMRKNPGLTFVAVGSLALGIGVNALVFSVMNALVLRPLAVEHPQQLRVVQNNAYGLGQSFPACRELRDRNQVFSGLLGYRVAQIALDGEHGATRCWGYLATGNYFDVLGVRPYIGRFFHQEDDPTPGASPYAVLPLSP